MEYRSEGNVLESETEEETVFPAIDISYAALSLLVVTSLVLPRRFH